MKMKKATIQITEKKNKIKNEKEEFEYESMDLDE